MVAGDVMLDVFEEGHVERISPEAPVPVLRNPRGYDVLGGAANAALNIHSLGVEATLLGLVGDDAAGRRCRALTRKSGLTEKLSEVPGWRTVMKHRFMAGGQQMLRVDTEDHLPAENSEALAYELATHMGEVSGVVLSDYDKGTVSESLARKSIALARERQVPVVVDSKCTRPAVFAGCTIIAPNHLEAARMTGTSDPEKAAAMIAADTNSAVLVTLGASGMLLFHDRTVDHIHSRALEVADVTGAGDSVTAGLIVGLVEGLSLIEAAQFAAAVAAVAVGHKGTYAVTRAEVTEHATT